VPSAQPSTSAPTACVYTLLDFSSSGKVVVNPDEWKKYGMRVDTVSGTVLTFYDYGGGIGDSLVVATTANPSFPKVGGKIMFTLDGTFEGNMNMKFFGLTEPARIDTHLVGGAPVSTYEVKESKVEQTVEVKVDGIFRVVVTFAGLGGISEVGVCRDPAATPAPFGLAPPTETSEPTVAPVASPTLAPVKTPTFPPIYECPDDVKIFKTIGETPLGEIPIVIRSRDVKSVTFSIKNTWTETLDFVYLEFDGVGHDEDCIKIEKVEKSEEHVFTAVCMQHVPVTVIGVYLSDAGAVLPGDAAEIPRCCHGPKDDTNPKVYYAFEVSCSCPTGAPTGASTGATDKVGFVSK
jgi:hypothetical protein